MCVRFTANKVVCSSELKIQKFRELGVLFSDGGIGKVDEVVLKEWMLENAIRVHF